MINVTIIANYFIVKTQKKIMDSMTLQELSFLLFLTQNYYYYLKSELLFSEDIIINNNGITIYPLKVIYGYGFNPNEARINRIKTLGDLTIIKDGSELKDILDYIYEMYTKHYHNGVKEHLKGEKSIFKTYLNICFKNMFDSIIYSLDENLVKSDIEKFLNIVSKQEKIWENEMQELTLIAEKYKDVKMPVKEILNQHKETIKKFVENMKEQEKIVKFRHAKHPFSTGLYDGLTYASANYTKVVYSNFGKKDEHRTAPLTAYVFYADVLDEIEKDFN